MKKKIKYGRKIRERVDFKSIYDLEGSVEDAIFYFMQMKDRYDGPDAKLEVEMNFHYYGDYHYIEIYRTRTETQEEFEERRLAAEKAEDARKLKEKKAAEQHKQKTLEEERKLYEELKKKFEGETT
jgi:hypothetical protein